MKNHFSAEHCPDFELPTAFVYPTFANHSGSLPADILEEIEAVTDVIVKDKMVECIRRLLMLLKTERSPRFTLEALLYSVGATVDGNGTQTNVANRLNISRQSFNYHCRTVTSRVAKKVSQLQRHAEFPFSGSISVVL